MADIGVKMGVESAQFKADMRNVNAELKTQKQEIKNLEKTFNSSTSAEEKFTSKGKLLSQMAQTAQQKVDMLNKKFEDEKSKLADCAKKLEEAKEKHGENSKEVEKAKLAYTNQATAVHNAKTALVAAKGEVDAITREYKEMENAVDKAGNEQKDFGQKVEDSGRKIDKTGKESKELGNEVETAGNKAGKAGNGGFTILKGVLANLATKAITTTISGLTKGLSILKDFGLSAIDVGKQFNASMSNVAALSGATGDDLKLLSDTAQHYGKTTQYSASEAADALGYMALAGWNAKQSAESLGGVLQLAAASGMGLAEASDMVTDYLSAFSNSAMTSTQFADMLAYAQANSNTSAQQLGEAYQNCAAKMNAAGQSAATTTALLGAMANQGYKGSGAGTALASVLKDLTAKMQNGSIEINKQKIAVQDAEGNYRNLINILYDVEAATDGMGTAQKNAALSSVFTSKSLSALSLVFNEGFENIEVFEEKLGDTSYQLWYLTENLGLSEEKAKDLLAAIRNSDRSEEAIKRIAKEFGVEAIQIQRTAEFFAACDGAAQKMADTMNDNLAGDIKAANSALEGFKITISDQLTPTLREFVQFGTSELGKLDDAFKSGGIEGFADQLGKSLSAGINMIKSKAPKFLSVTKTVIKTVGAEALKLASQLFNKFINNFGKISDKILSTAKNLGSKILSKLPGFFDKLISQLPSLLSKLGSFLKSALPKVAETIGQMLGSFFANAPAIISAGAQLIQSLLTGILQGIPKLFSGIFSGAKNSFAAEVKDYATESAKQIEAVYNPVLEEVRAQLSEIPDSTGRVESSLAEINGKQKEAEHWIEIFDQLSQKVNPSAEETERLNTAVNKLKELYPELDLVLDDDTGKWNLNTQEIRDNIQALADREKANAYYSQGGEILKEIAGIELAQHKVTDEIERTSSEADKYKRIVENISGLEYISDANLQLMQDASQKYNDLNLQTISLREEEKKLSNQLNEKKSDYEWVMAKGDEFTKKSNEEIIPAIEDTADAVSDFSDECEVSFSVAQEVIDAANGKMKEMPKVAEEAFSSTADEARDGGYEVGKELMLGTGSGVDDYRGALMQKARSAVSAALAAMKEKLGIHSPSTVAKNLIGKNIGLGITKGFEEIMNSSKTKEIFSMNPLLNSMESSGLDLTSTITHSLDGSTIGAYSGKKIVNNITIGNITINGGPGMTADDLYDELKARFNQDFDAEEAVFA